ncbi:MAG: hypothetical protein AMXMBFR61_18190 [Fimbriimonadales bacterium]
MMVAVVLYALTAFIFYLILTRVATHEPDAMSSADAKWPDQFGLEAESTKRAA